MLRVMEKLKGRRISWKVWLGVVLMVLVLIGVGCGAYQYGEWSTKYRRVWQYPVLVEFQSLTYIEERKPLEILSPVAEEIIQETPSNLNENEQIILEIFGEREFAVARALAKCESGMNPLAINWQSKDFGLMQVNLPVWEKLIEQEFGYNRADLLDARKNVEVAYWIWDRADGEEGNGKGNYSPWVAKYSSCFLAEL